MLLLFVGVSLKFGDGLDVLILVSSTSKQLMIFFVSLPFRCFASDLRRSISFIIRILHGGSLSHLLEMERDTSTFGVCLFNLMIVTATASSARCLVDNLPHSVTSKKVSI